MNYKNITMVRGDTLSFGMQLLELDKDLDSAYFTCKQNYTDELNAFQKSLGDGITKIGTGEYVVRVAPEDTKHMEPGKYFYDLQIGVNTDIFTVMHGVLELLSDTTLL